MDILIVDDDLLHCDILKNRLAKLGFTEVVYVKSFDEAATYLQSFTPDLIFLDFYLDGTHNAKQFVKELLKSKEIPVIIISSFYGPDLLGDVLETIPVDFIPKNVGDFELIKSIELALYNKEYSEKTSKLKDYIFVKAAKEINKIKVDDIQFVTVDGKYIELYVFERRYLVRSTLTDFVKRLPDYFIRIHKAYVVNIRHLDSINIDENIVRIGKESLPLSRNYKKDLLSKYYLA